MVIAPRTKVRQDALTRERDGVPIGRDSDRDVDFTSLQLSCRVYLLLCGPHTLSSTSHLLSGIFLRWAVQSSMDLRVRTAAVVR